MPITQIINKAHRLRTANNPTNLEALFSYLFLSTNFFLLFRVSSMNLSGLSITLPICHLIHFFCFGFSLRKLGHFLFLFTRFYLQILILIGRFAYNLSAFHTFRNFYRLIH
jgi:hypothetical protein